MKKLFRTHEANVRQPRFELHLKIYDLNNVPLVAGWSLIKWHIVHSMHAEHRGATERRAITNHRVHYSYSKLVGNVRIPIDKSLRLSECWLELEVLQEYSSGGLRDEKVPLGKVRVNLGEFVEESMNMDIQLLSRRRPAAMASSAAGSSLSSQYDAQDGIIRRYLLQDSKINSTLKIGVLMVQVDGDRNYAAPPLKTAPVFGGLTGVFVGEAPDQEDGNKVPMIASNKARDVAEVDLYRSMLIASWNCPLDELRADEAIEDIFHQGDSKHSPYSPHPHHPLNALFTAITLLRMAAMKAARATKAMLQPAIITTVTVMDIGLVLSHIEAIVTTEPAVASAKPALQQSHGPDIAAIVLQHKTASPTVH
ncbi:putative protein.08c [Ceratocystis platani]|uniref:C2 NT-type domain-containing protein n=1 Tax=Ceratocystis fimbriata f. sp. platani TaxID=88771 RepID=A0A0F8BVX5_CERFI|nr:putative protein.08c [Ceratocystis platani]